MFRVFILCLSLELVVVVVSCLVVTLDVMTSWKRTVRLLRPPPCCGRSSSGVCTCVCVCVHLMSLLVVERKVAQSEKEFRTVLLLKPEVGPYVKAKLRR